MIRMKKDKLFNEFKKRVAIANFEAEYEKKQNLHPLKKRKNQNRKKLKLSNVAAFLAVVVVIGCVTPTIYAKIKWNIEFYKYEKSVETPRETLDYAKESGFADKIEDNYVIKDGIGIKLESFLITDDTLDMRVKFKFAEEKEVDSDSFGFGYVIYDENKNIYDLRTRMYMDRQKEHDLMVAALDKLEANYDPNAILASILNDSSSIEAVETTEDRTIVKDITLRAKDRFPKSKKIYIQFFDLGCLMMDFNGMQGQVDLSQIDMEDFPLTDKEWILEKNTSEKFSERDTLNLVLKDEIPDFEIEKCTLTESGMVLDFKSEEYSRLVAALKEVDGKLMSATWKMVTITDESGKEYEQLESGSTEKRHL